MQYTQTWVYDAFGNITSTSKYPYTTGELGTPTSTVSYGYTDSNWGDLLTEYNGQTIEYDEIGNPLTVTDSEGNVVESFTWTQGRQLASHTTNGVTWSYTYDADGLRTGRTDGTNTYQYIYAGDKLVRMIYNGEVVDISYAGSQPLSLTYDGATYYYVLNGQGDVIGLTDSTGTMAIGYTYGAYGTIMALAADENLAPVLVQMNPLTYRGYVYDREIKFFYLQSRYYDPELGRFINADAYASTGQGILGNNMFAYCLNNPVVLVDSSGNAAHIGFSHDGQPHYAPWRVGSPGGGGWFQDIHYTKKDYGSVADKFYTVRALKFVFNTDEAVVLEAEYFAFYHGVLVLKLDFLGGDGFSFGIIGIGPDSDVQTLRHEFGHYLHLRLIGVKNYTSKVAMPSLIDYWSPLTYDLYYSEPQEYIADILGQVNRTHNGQPYHYTITDREAILYFIYSLIP